MSSGTGHQRVVHVIGALIAGGAERFAVALLQRLRRRGVDARLWALSSRTDAVGAAMRRELEFACIPFASGPTARVGTATVAWYVRRLWQERPQIVHLHTPNTEMAQCLAGSFYRQPVSLFRTLHSSAWPAGRLAKLAYRRNRAQGTIACSAAAAAAAPSAIQGESQTIGNGVEFASPLRESVQIEYSRRVLKLDPALRHYVHVGRMSGPELDVDPKAQDILLQAWRNSGVGWRGGQLHLIGDGPCRSALERIAAGDPSIRFHGVRTDVQEWLTAADYFVMPSRTEGMPLAALEAIGAGLPCILSDIAPLRELVPPLAYWVPVNDVASLADTMSQTSELSPVLPRDVIEEFRGRHSIERTADRYLRVYAGECRADSR